MASLPGIIIKVGAQTSDAIQGLNRVNSALGKTMTKGQKFSAVSGKVGKALLGMGAAAGAAAVAVGVESVQAFIDDERAAAQLNNTLQNMGFADATGQVADLIDKMQFAANVTEEELRPAYSRLLRSTGSLADAQRGLRLALDISAATGKDLDTVANGLGKAYDGNRASLGRLGLGMDAATLKMGSMSDLVGELEGKFGGASAAQANTLSGAMDGVKIAFDELKESFGEGLVLGSDGGTDDTVESLARIEAQLRNNRDTARVLGQTVNDTASDFGNFVYVANAVGQLWDRGQRMDAIKLMFEGDAEAARAAAREINGVTTAMNYMGAAAKLAGLRAERAAIGVDRFAAAGFTAVPLGTAAAKWGAIDQQLAGARTQQAWREMEARNDARRRRQQERARARAEARAKKKEARLNVSTVAKEMDSTFRRAGARTGTKFTQSVEANKRSC